MLRSRDFEDERINRVALSRLVEDGVVERVGRGLYGLSQAKVTEHHTLVEAALRVPTGTIVCSPRFSSISSQRSPHTRFGWRLA